MSFLTFRFCSFGRLIAATTIFLSCATAVAQNRPSLDVPYIKTPAVVVEQMLEIAEVSADDVLLDLGSGDGRISIAAAKTYGTQGLGVDLDPARTEEAIAVAKAEGVDELVTFRTENLFDTDLSRATIISMYLFPEINLRLRPKLLELEPGTRIVSHAFHMDDWTPERHEIVEGRDIFMWTVPAQVKGLWHVSAPNLQHFALQIWQQFDRIQGTAITLDQRSIPLANMTVHGANITFHMKTTDGIYAFSGKVSGEHMTGSSERAGQWTAEKM